MSQLQNFGKRRGKRMKSAAMAQFTVFLLFIFLLSPYCSGEPSSFNQASTPKQSSPAPSITRVSRAPLRVPVIKGRIPYKMPGDMVIGSENSGQQNKETTPPGPTPSPPLPSQGGHQSGHHHSSNSNSNFNSNFNSNYHNNNHHHHQQAPQQSSSREVPKSPPPPLKNSNFNANNNHHNSHQNYQNNNFQPSSISNFPPSFFNDINSNSNNKNHHNNNHNQQHHSSERKSASGSGSFSGGNSAYRKPEGSVQAPVKVPLPPSGQSVHSDLQTNEVTPVKSNMKMGRFPLDELVNAIAQAAINGDIPFNKVDLRKPYKAQSLQIPILLLRPEDLYRATGHKINFKLITASPIRIPIFDEPPAPFKLPPSTTSIHGHHKARQHHHQHNNHHHNHHQNVNHFNQSPFNNFGNGHNNFGGNGGHREGRQMNFNNQGNFGGNFNGQKSGPNNNDFVLFPNNNNNGHSIAPPFNNVQNFNNQPKNNHFLGGNTATPTFTTTTPNFPTTVQQQQQMTTLPPREQQNFNQQVVGTQNANSNNKNYGKPPKSPKLDVLKVIPAPKLVKPNNDQPSTTTSNHIDSNVNSEHSRKNFDDQKHVQNNNHQNNNHQNNLQNHNFNNNNNNDHKNPKSFSHHSDHTISSFSSSGPPSAFGHSSSPSSSSGSSFSSNGPHSTGSSNSVTHTSQNSFPQFNQKNNFQNNKQTSNSQQANFNTGSNSGSSNSNSDSSSSSSSSEGSTGKRKRPVIRIKPDRPPVRVNSVRAPIRVKPERPPVRMNPMIRKKDGSSQKYDDNQSTSTGSGSSSSGNVASSSNIAPIHDDPEQPKTRKSSVIPEKYLKNMPPFRSDEDIKTVPFPKFSNNQEDNGSSELYDTPQNHLQSGGQRSTFSSSSQFQTQFDDDHVNINAAFSKASHAKQNGKNLDFGSVFRKEGEDQPEVESSRTSSGGHTTRTTSGNIDDLEKSGYDKQLVKTLKNLMATTGKRHKLNFEDEEESSKEETKVTRRGKIPDKYLQGSPLEKVINRSQGGGSSGVSEFDDHYKTSESNFQKQRTSQQPYQHFNGAEGDDRQSAVAEDHHQKSGQPLFNTELAGSYRVAGFDPNYEYIDASASSVPRSGTEVSSLAHQRSHNLEGASEGVLSSSGSEGLPFDDSYTQEETVGPDGKTVKRYVMTGVYRHKVAEDVVGDGSDQVDSYRAEESDPVPAEVLVAKVFESNRTKPKKSSEGVEGLLASSEGKSK